MDIVEDAEEPQSSRKANSLHAHRLDHSPSKLPAFRFADLNRVPLSVNSLLPSDLESANASQAIKQGITASTQDDFVKTTTTDTPINSDSPTKRPSTFPGVSATPHAGSYFPLSPSQSTPASGPRLQDKRPRKAPASHSSNGIETATGPPPALSTQRSTAAEPPRIPITSTTEWALAQQQLAFHTLSSPATPNTSIEDTKTTENTRNLHGASRSLDDNIPSRPLIPPIRSFRSSAARASIEMNPKAFHRFEAQIDDQDTDRDRTLRALEGFSDEERNTKRSHTIDQNDQRQADAGAEDLFLNLARNDLNRESDNGDGGNLSRTERRRSRIALASNRQSLPQVTSYQQSAGQSMPRRGSGLHGTSTVASRDDVLRNQHPDSMSYQSSPRDRSVASSSHPVSDFTRTRYSPAVRSFPSTPRGISSGRESASDSQLSNGGRRSSVPPPSSNASVSARSSSYRQSNLSYSTPRVYNSSPLVARNKEVEDGLDNPRIAEGTESTASTTAPSTVWDELDDLKSRIRKLELTGKLPATSGAAVSHASGERPPTATTTITTMSTSPKRGRGLSTSPVDSNGTGPPIGETHPLLHSALEKSKPLLGSEVYKALESTASDALNIAAMTGSIGQSGATSSAQSVIGNGAPTVTDRQLRRKADSLCRSLTELCLALSEIRPEQPQQPVSQALVRPGSLDRELQNGALDPSQHSGDSLTRVRSSPRALSRLEARRSSLLATSSLPAPRYTPSEVSTPTQSSITGRRTSILLRSRHAGELEEEDEGRFRAPSRAATEIGRIRNSPREYTSQQALPDARAPSVQSSLPLRRHYIPTSLNPSVPQSPAGPNLGAGNRKFLDRSTPERDTNGNSVINKLAEERGQRVAGTGLAYSGRGLGRTGSLNKDRRVKPQLREQENTQGSLQVEVGGYQ